MDIQWPEGKKFAFTIFDDTDLTTLENGPVVYNFLREHGFRTTKSVWPIDSPNTALCGGATCTDPAYVAWAQELQSQGFEIALHNSSYATCTREEIARAFEAFNEMFGHYPAAHANHTGCEDGLYWGDARLTGLRKLIYNALTKWRNSGAFKGHVEGDPLFWGDIAKQHVRYVRNFIFPQITTSDACPAMPYHDPLKPYANAWFASTEGATAESFIAMLSEENQDALEASGGLCIMYTHFGAGFVKDGTLDPRFAARMQRLSQKNGWFAPVSEVLDYIANARGVQQLTGAERARLEWKWLVAKIRAGGTS